MTCYFVLCRFVELFLCSARKFPGKFHAIFVISKPVLIKCFITFDAGQIDTFVIVPFVLLLAPDTLPLSRPIGVIVKFPVCSTCIKK